MCQKLDRLKLYLVLLGLVQSSESLRKGNHMTASHLQPSHWERVDNTYLTPDTFIHSGWPLDNVKTLLVRPENNGGKNKNTNIPPSQTRQLWCTEWPGGLSSCPATPAPSVRRTTPCWSCGSRTTTSTLSTGESWAVSPHPSHPTVVLPSVTTPVSWASPAAPTGATSPTPAGSPSYWATSEITSPSLSSHWTTSGRRTTASTGKLSYYSFHKLSHLSVFMKGQTFPPHTRHHIPNIVFTIHFFI